MQPKHYCLAVCEIPYSSFFSFQMRRIPPLVSKSQLLKCHPGPCSSDSCNSTAGIYCFPLSQLGFLYSSLFLSLVLEPHALGLDVPAAIMLMLSCHCHKEDCSRVCTLVRILSVPQYIVAIQWVGLQPSPILLNYKSHLPKQLPTRRATSPHTMS